MSPLAAEPTRPSRHKHLPAGAPRATAALIVAVAAVTSLWAATSVSAKERVVRDHRGRVLKRYQVVGGKRNGPYRSYYSSGNLWHAGSYLRGKRHGLWKDYDSDGTLIFETPYVHGKRHGVQRQYGGKVSCPGRLVATTTWRRGLRDGPYVSYDCKGVVVNRGQYVEGRREGTWKYYGILGKGKLISTTPYLCGKPHGTKVWYRPDGSVRKTVRLRADPKYLARCFAACSRRAERWRWAMLRRIPGLLFGLVSGKLALYNLIASYLGNAPLALGNESPPADPRCSRLARWASRERKQRGRAVRRRVAQWRRSVRSVKEKFNYRSPTPAGGSSHAGYSEEELRVHDRLTIPTGGTLSDERMRLAGTRYDSGDRPTQIPGVLMKESKPDKTRLTGLKPRTYRFLERLARAAGNPITVTGATERGHKRQGQPGSHSSGDRVDIGLEKGGKRTGITAFVFTRGTRVRDRTGKGAGECYEVDMFPGVLFVRERGSQPHWHIELPWH